MCIVLIGDKIERKISDRGGKRITRYGDQKRAYLTFALGSGSTGAVIKKFYFMHSPL